MTDTENPDKHEFIYSTHPTPLHAPKAQMKVAELKTIIGQAVSGFNPGDTLVEESRGDNPDVPLNDTDTVEIRHKPHFYSQPPANFG